MYVSLYVSSEIEDISRALLKVTSAAAQRHGHAPHMDVFIYTYPKDTLKLTCAVTGTRGLPAIPEEDAGNAAANQLGAHLLLNNNHPANVRSLALGTESGLCSRQNRQAGRVDGFRAASAAVGGCLALEHGRPTSRVLSRHDEINRVYSFNDAALTCLVCINTCIHMCTATGHLATRGFI